jgi:predicted PurR-regulated permease PerM
MTQKELGSTSPPSHVTPAATPSSRALTGVIVGVVIVAALYFGKDVLLPVTVAVLLSFVLSPLVWALRRLHISRVVAVLFSVALALATIGGVGALVARQLIQVAGDLPRYQTTIENKVDAVRSATVGQISELAARLRGAIAQSEQASPTTKPSTTGRAATPEQAPVPVEVHQPPPDALQLAGKILTPVLHPLMTAAIIFVVTLFVLMQQDDLRDRLIRLFGSRDLHRTTLALDDAARRLSRFFLVQLGINTAFGVIIGAALYFIGLPSPLLWGTTAGLMRFVPYIGSYVGAGLPILLAAAVDSGWSMALWVAALFLVTEPLMGQVVEPTLYGRSTGLSPISVVISAIFWTWLWGPVGLILSTPLTLCLVVLGQHVKQLEFLSVLFGDQPALTRVESFYQRVLAEDLDELQEHAEDLLHHMSLSSYYDQVAIKGLELAAHDIERGVLTRTQAEHIKEVVTTLIAELSDYEAVESTRPDQIEAAATASAAVSQTSLKVLGSKPVIPCIACRGPLDETAAAMLAQLLTKRGLKAEVVTPGAVSRKEIANFGREGIPIICICYIDASGSTSCTRFLLRRLRQHVPEARLLVAFWSFDHPVLSDQRRRQSLGADDYVSSLQAAVNFCSNATQDAASKAKKSTDRREPAAAGRSA